MQGMQPGPRIPCHSASMVAFLDRFHMDIDIWSNYMTPSRQAQADAPSPPANQVQTRACMTNGQDKGMHDVQGEERMNHA